MLLIFARSKPVLPDEATISSIKKTVTAKTGLDLANINNIYFTVNIVVFVIFFVDLIRLYRQSNGFKDFVYHNWLDILATIPFGIIANAGANFEVLKLSRLSRLFKFSRASRIAKIGKEFKAASHLKKESEKYKRKHRI
jgi:hypothetical protein